MDIEKKMKKGKTNVVIFGEAGVGKSSMVNMLLGYKKAKTSAGAKGCTKFHKAYKSPCKRYRYFDSAGLNEGSAGAVPAGQAVKGIVKLLTELRNKGGVHLLIYVTKKGRINSAFEKNYKLFVEILCQGKVPTILAITHCEYEQKMGDWWEKEQSKFLVNYKMNFIESFSLCTSDGQDDKINQTVVELMANLHDESRKMVSKAIEAHSLEIGWKMDSLASWLGVMGVSFLNLIRGTFGLTQVEMNTQLKHGLVEHGIQELEAVQICNDMCKASVEL